MLHESGRGLAPNCQGAVTRQYPSASALPINDMSGIFTDAQTRDLGRRVWMLVKSDLIDLAGQSAGRVGSNVGLKRPHQTPSRA